MAPLADQLATLGLRYSAAHLDDVVALATKRRWSVTQLLEHLVERERRVVGLAGPPTRNCGAGWRGRRRKAGAGDDEC